MIAVLARAEHHGLRADRVLAALLADLVPGVSRAVVQRWMDAGRIRSAGQSVAASHKVSVGQAFEVEPAPEAASQAAAEAGVAFELVYVDDHLLVVDKPAGLVVHPARGHEGGTLVNGLLGRGLFAREELSALRDEADEHDRPGIVHRIDKDTSGLLVVARTAAAREHLKKQFAAHSIERAYTALVVGHCESGTLSTLHGRHPKERLKFSSRVSEGKRAITHVQLRAAYGSLASRVECRLETGRTHQIRVHLADRGTPLLGDTLYGKPPRHAGLRALGDRLGRQALHAGVLGFEHPAHGGTLRFESPWPEDLRAAVAELEALVAGHA